MDEAERVFWDTVFLKSLEAAFRAPGNMTVEAMISTCTSFADAALAERRKRG